MRVVGWFAKLLVATILALAVGVGLGAASPWVFVIGLLPLLLGLVAGAGGGFTILVSGHGGRRGALVAALIAIAVGWTAFQAMDDVHFRKVFAADVALARYAESGMPPADLSAESGLAFYNPPGAPTADTLLGREVTHEFGFSGPLARWLFRAKSGVRLFGPWEASLGLPVGLPGAIVWALLEWVLAVLVARSVIGRIVDLRDLRAREPLRPLDEDSG